jgi:hypothetical protein
MSYPLSIRGSPMCLYYRFTFFPKGCEVSFEENNNQVKQTIPFTQMASARLTYLYEDKIWLLELLLKDSIKYAYCFKCNGDAEKVYEQIRDGLLT